MEQPRFWTDYRINVTGENFPEQIESLRLRLVGSLEFHGCVSAPQMSQLLDIREELRVREVIVNNSVYSVSLLRKVSELMVSVEAGVFKNNTGYLEVVTNRLSRIHYTVIFKAIIKCDQLKLKSLQLAKTYILTHVSPNILSKAVVRYGPFNSP